MKNTPRILTTLCLLIALTGCNRFPYRIDVEQGNVISQAQLSQLSVGMTKEEVQTLLGSSLLSDIFHNNRWDYVQYYKNGASQKVQEGLVSLYFTNGLLGRIDAERITTIEKSPVSYGTLAQQKAVEIEEVIFNAADRDN